MGREVRKVPPDWQHPKNEHGNFVPLFDGSAFQEWLRDWQEGNKHWELGEIKCWSPSGSSWKPKTDAALQYETYAEWAGEKPKAEDYMPVWSPEQATFLMMFENTSEGTPISPAFAAPEELARWLADNNASAFGNMTATYEQWLNMIGQGFSVSMVIAGGCMMSGVAASVHI